MSSNLTMERCVVRGTNRGKGRRLALSPATSAARQLHYGRVTLDPRAQPLRFDTGESETGFVSLRGSAEVRTGGRVFTLTPYDALYVPRDADVEVRPGAAGCDLAEIAAPVARATRCSSSPGRTCSRTRACTSRRARRPPSARSTS